MPSNTRCGCERCSVTPLQTFTERFRQECEAREVLGWDKGRRRAYYAQVKAKRGEQAMQQLVADVKRLWQAK